jgi:hypothetical protein
VNNILRIHIHVDYLVDGHSDVLGNIEVSMISWYWVLLFDDARRFH